jgi:hypothetical protein
MPALELGGMTLGVREGVIALITLVAIYMLFVLLRMRHLRNKPAPSTTPSPSPAQPVEPVDATPKVADVGQALDALTENQIESDVAWQRESNELAEETLRQGLVQEVAQLRDEVDAIRGELAALRQDLQQEVAHLHSAQPVSPIYGDAMQMAVAGYDPVMIADRCGIARAEAELVVALAKSQMQ